MIKILIVNGFGFGLEVAEWIKEMPGYGTDFMLKGFLDNRPSTTRPDILADPMNYFPEKNEKLVIALRQPADKKHMADVFRSREGKYFNVIHPSNKIASSAQLSEGLICAPFNHISTEAVIEPHVTLYGFVRIGHHTRIGAYSHLSAHTIVSGFAQVPEGTLLESFNTIK